MTLLHHFEATLIGGLARTITGVVMRAPPTPDAHEPSVYFANHSSHLDAVILWAALPPAHRARVRPVAARDYWERGPLRRHLASSVFHVILVERGDHASGSPAASAAPRIHATHQALEAMLTALASGDSLIIFPEGTRGSGAELGTFRSGIYHLARQRPQTPFVPVYLENLNRVLPKGEFLPVPFLGSLRFGAPLRLAEHEDRIAFLERSRQALETLRSS